jgi:hypothetical protein
MRHVTALALFTFGYLLTAALDPQVAALPALTVFGLGAYRLATSEERLS